VFVGVLIIAASACSRRQTVVVINDAENALTEVKVTYRGGETLFSTLEAHSRREGKMRTYGESHAVLNFRDWSGIEHRAPIDVYFESGYSGALTIRVGP